MQRSISFSSRFIKELIDEAELFELHADEYKRDISGFKQWLFDSMKGVQQYEEPDWEGKSKGRSPESIINTHIVHLNRYAKNYSKAAIYGSAFSTQEEFIYLINLKAVGAMSKTELIQRNVQDKPVGMQIINRLIAQGWVRQKNSPSDKRSKIIELTKAGREVLEGQMDKIRKASSIVTGNLTHTEKMELIRLLGKLDRFHHDIFTRNIPVGELLDVLNSEFSTDNN